MQPQRRLALDREALSELGSVDLRAVAGGSHIYTECGHPPTLDGFSCACPTLPLSRCVQQVTSPIVVSSPCA